MIKWCYYNLIACLLLSGCSGKPGDAGAGGFDSSPGLEVKERQNRFGQTEKIQQRIADGVRQGRYQRLNQQGIVIEEAYYQNDTLHGRRVLFFSQGDTLSVENYDMGTFQGAFRQYYEGGQLQLEGMYIDNEMTGKWRQYYENGQLMEVVTFEENLENGPFLEYHPNGQLKAEGYYLNGDYEHGLLKLYDEQGRLERKMDCERGVCRTIWKAPPAENS